MSSTVKGMPKNQVKYDSSADGILFVKGLNWEQIVEKATQERKFIFVDCFASWCGPCKQMDIDVYSKEYVGQELNNRFISVKAQLDTAKGDDAVTRSFYPSAHYICSRYQISFYPTLLFFTPDGRLLNRVVGAMTSDAFLRIANDVQNPQKDYYALLAKYKSGERNFSSMRFLAHVAKDILIDTVESKAIAKDYLGSIPKGELFSPDNILFIREFTRHSYDVGFQFFYQNADSVDKVMRDLNYSESAIQEILNVELVAPVIRRCRELNMTPDWNSLSAIITEKYSEYYADRVVLGAKTTWTGRRKEWHDHTRYLIQYIEKYGSRLDTGQYKAYYLNEVAWDIFQHSADTSELNKACQWSSRSVIMNPIAASIDTYANILYKLGRAAAALKWEAISVTLAPGQKAILMNYEAMKAGRPTWPSN